MTVLRPEYPVPGVPGQDTVVRALHRPLPAPPSRVLLAAAWGALAAGAWLSGGSGTCVGTADTGAPTTQAAAQPGPMSQLGVNLVRHALP